MIEPFDDIFGSDVLLEGCIPDCPGSDIDSDMETESEGTDTDIELEVSHFLLLFETSSV